MDANASTLATPSSDSLVDKMLGCGNPDTMGDLANRCRHYGEGTHRVVMHAQSSLCWCCAKVDADNWGGQVSQMLHEGVLYRHMVLPVPAM